MLERLGRSPFLDPVAVARWEAQWAQRWGRPAVAFAGAGELVATLARVMGWGPGTPVAASALLAPLWREALAQAWLPVTWLDLGEESVPSPVCFHLHPFGLPGSLPDAPCVIEEITPCPLPLPGVGGGLFQILQFSGNAPLQAGNACLILGRDAGLMAALADGRPRLPAAASCWLGSWQGEMAPFLMARRRELAERYLAVLRPRGRFRLPPGGERGWEAFVIEMQNTMERHDLEMFLNKSAIACGDPVWHVTPEGMRGVEALRRHGLSLPCHPALGDGEQKRIINRVHRWVEKR